MARPAIRPPNRLGRLKLSSKGLHVSEVVRSCEVGSGPDGDSKGFIIPKHSMGLPYIYIYMPIRPGVVPWGSIDRQSYGSPRQVVSGI